MTITPVSPCYLKSIGSTRWELLKLGQSIPIGPGDICSLLPWRSWFKVIQVSASMDESSYKRKAEDELTEEPPDKKSFSQSSVEATVSPSENNMPNIEEDIAEIQAANANDSSQQVSASSSHKTKGNSEEGTAAEESARKIKWDCAAHFSDGADLAAASSIQDTRPTDGNSTSNLTRRDKCTYGDNCYRKNLEHKARYSHPGDSDYDIADDRPECRFGVCCYRKNPQHRKEYKHTVNRRRRRATPIRTLTPEDDSNLESSVEESVDESDYDPSLFTSSENDEDTEDDEV